MKNFKKKEEIVGKLKLLKQKHLWTLYNDSLQTVKEQERALAEVEKKKKRLDETIAPIKNKMSDLLRQKGKIEGKANNLDKRVRDLHALQIVKRVIKLESIPEKIQKIVNDYKKLLAGEKAKKDAIGKAKAELQALRTEYEAQQNIQGEKNEILEAKVKQAEKEMELAHSKKNEFEAMLKQKIYEAKSLGMKLQELDRDEAQLLNTRRQKMETLQRSFQHHHGSDAIKAMKWLEENREMFSGQVYEPLIMTIDIQDAARNAKFFENTIAQRDLVAFAAENAEDANKLMTSLRDMGLRVNVLQVDPLANPDQFRPDYSKVQNNKDFIGFLSDMINCPGPIKAFLCKLYHLAQIPVFHARAERDAQNLVEQYRLFFVGDTRYSVVSSHYSKQKSTSSVTISDRRMLQISMDKDRVKEVKTMKNKVNSKWASLNEEIENDKDHQRTLAQELEASMKGVKHAKQKLNEKLVLKGRLMAKEKIVQEQIRKTSYANMEKEESHFKYKIDEQKQTFKQTIVEGMF